MIRFVLQTAIVVLAACAAMVGGYLSWLAATASFDAKPIARQEPSQSIGAERGPETAFAAPALERLRATVTNPVFFEGRRYPPRELPRQQQSVAPLTPPQPPPPTLGSDRLKLRGVRDFDGKPQVLIEMIQPATNARSIDAWLSVGEVFQGWKVEAISGNAVSLRNGGQSATLELYSAPRSN